MERRVTIRDIAKEAGVHFTTVSRALARHPSIPLATSERIKRIAKRLDYVPDPMLSALTAYRSQLRVPTFHGNIAWVNNSFSQHGWNTCTTFDLFFKGATNRANELGYKLEEFWLREPGMTPRRATDILAARNIRGLILSPQPRAKMRIRLNWAHFAAVALGYTLAWPPLHTVTANCFQCMQITVRHLRALGYRRLGLVLTPASDERVNHGWSGGLLALRQRWAPEEVIPIHAPDTITHDGFLKWVHDYQPDVVISHELELLDTLEKNGFNVPHDIGFATQTLTSSPHLRKISGTDENAPQTGITAVDILVGMMHCGEWGLPQRVQNTLITGSWHDGETTLRRRAPSDGAPEGFVAHVTGDATLQ